MDREKDSLKEKRSTYFDIRADQQIKFIDAQNTYKLKLATTHSVNYTPAGGVQTAHGTGLSSPNGDQNGDNVWYLPALHSNHIKNCLIRVVAVNIPLSVYSFEAVEDSITNYNKHVLSQNPNMYITCSSVIDKSYVSSSSGDVHRRNILGSINTTSLIKFHTDPSAKTGNPITQGHPTNKTNIVDGEWVLCDNPFGNKIEIHLISPTDLSRPLIKSSADGLLGEYADMMTTVSNLLLDAPITYELEIKLLPNFKENDRNTY